MGFFEDLLQSGEDLFTSTFDPEYGLLGRPVSGAVRSIADIGMQMDPGKHAERLAWSIFRDPVTDRLIRQREENEARARAILDQTLGAGLGTKMIGEPTEEIARRVTGAEGAFPELFKSAVLPETLPGDVSPISKPSMDFPLGIPRTREDIEDVVETSRQLSGAAESVGGLIEQAPELMAIPAAPGLGMAFLPGASESLGANIAGGDYGKAVIDALFLGLIGKGEAGLAKPRTSSQRQSRVEAEPVEDLTMAMESTPQEQLRNVVTGTIASRPGPARDTALAHLRLDALLSEAAPELGRRASEVLSTPELSEMGFQYEPGTMGRYGEKGKVLYDPIELAGGVPSNVEFADLIKYMLEHEPAHGQVLPEGEVASHALGRDTIKGIEGELFGEEAAIPALQLGETKVGLPLEAFQHTREGGETRASIDYPEHVFQGGRNILEHDPYYQHLTGQIRDALLEAPDIFEALSGRKATEAVSEPTMGMELPPEKAAARARMEAQLAREDAQRKRDVEIDKLIQQGRDAKLAGNVEEANRINAQVLELRNAPLPEIPPKPEVTTFREEPKPKLTADQIIERAVEAEKPRLVPKKSEAVTEPPVSEGVISAPANNLRKLLQATKLTKFNVNTLKQSLKEKGIDLPAEVEGEIPNLVKELRDQGWLQEKIGGTYTVLAAPGKTMKGISKGKPVKTGKIGKQIEETLKTVEPKPAIEIKGKYIEKLSDTALKNLRDKLPEGSQGRVDVEREITRREAVPTQPAALAAEHPLVKAYREDPNSIKLSSFEGELTPTEAKFLIAEEPGLAKYPWIKRALGEAPPIGTLAEKMKANLTEEEIAAIGNLFGTTTKPKKGTKEIPEEVRLAQQAALKNLAEKETEKAGGPKAPSIEEVGEGGEKVKPFEVTLNDGTTHIVRASSAEEAKSKAEGVLEEYGSTKIVDKVEEHLTTLEKAAKHEVEPVKVGTEAVAEELKETKKAVSEEVKETGKVGREEERLRKAQAKEKFERRAFNVALSNGRTVVVKARNEKIAREIAEREIKRKGSGVTVESVGLKPSALESAITGGARKLEESGFLQNPVVKVLNAVKSIAFGGDVGHLLRQGKQMNADLLFSKDARKVLEQLPVIFKSAKSEEFFTNFNEQLYSDPLTKRMVDDFGLDMPGMGAHYKEEAFHGAGLAEKVPIVGRFFAKPSERAYTAGLNFLRDAEIHKWANTLQKDGFTPDNAPEKYHAMARAVNIISQRGHFQPAYQKLFSDASAIYGAPRAKAARLQNAFELFRGGTSGRIVRTTAAKTLAFNAGLFGLLAATTGAKLITDSESSDYGKIRISPKITVDPWMGLGVTARTVAKLVHGRAKSPYTGKEYPVSPSDALMQEFLGGIAPGIKLAWEAMSGKDLRGYQVERLSSLLNITPLTARSVAELLKEGDIDEALLLSILQLGGEGVDVFDYEEAKKKQQKLREERGLSRSKGRPRFPF